MSRIVSGFVLTLLALAPAAALAHAPGAAPHDHGANTDGDHDHGANKDGAHDHGAPHGGEVVDLGDIHAEVVFGEHALLVYFYDKDMKPLPAPPTAKATLAVGKAVKKGDLTHNMDHVAGPLATPKAGKATVVVQAEVAGKARTIRAERKEGKVAGAIPYHDHLSLRGGQVGMSGDDHVELLAEKGGSYKVWFTDGHRKAITAGVQGKLIVTAADGRTETIELAGPGKDGLLTGKGSAMDGVGRKVQLDAFANGYPFRFPFEIPATK